MSEPVVPIAWHLHLCRNAAYWRGGQFAKARSEFLALLAQTGRTPQPVKVTIWTDPRTLHCYEDWAAALGLVALPLEIEIRVVDVEKHHHWSCPLETSDELVQWDKKQALQIWENAVEHQIETASADLKNVFPDFPPPWLAEYQQTQMCLLLAQYP